jgi:tripartite motif-containing protein 71
MVREAKSTALILRLLVVLALLGCPQIGSAAGTWSVISLPQNSDEWISPIALVTDAAGDLYVAAFDGSAFWIQKRNTQGIWSVIATGGDHPGQVDHLNALAVDTAGNIYVAEGRWPSGAGSRIQIRDAQSHWSVIAAAGTALGQVNIPTGLAVDGAGNLFVADWGDAGESNPESRIQKRDAQGNWSLIATEGDAPGQIISSHALTVDAAGNLFVADSGNSRIQKRDVRGQWSVIATEGAAPGQVVFPRALAVDTPGNLYVSDPNNGQIQKRDAHGNWSILATAGEPLGQVLDALGLAVATTGDLYVADTANNRVQRYTPFP